MLVSSFGVDILFYVDTMHITEFKGDYSPSIPYKGLLMIYHIGCLSVSPDLTTVTHYHKYDNPIV